MTTVASSTVGELSARQPLSKNTVKRVAWLNARRQSSLNGVSGGVSRRQAGERIISSSDKVAELSAQYRQVRRNHPDVSAANVVGLIMPHLSWEYALVLAGEWLGMTGHVQPNPESGARAYVENFVLHMEDPEDE